MAARNDITGDRLQSKATSDKFRDGWERIFSKEKPSARTEIEDDEVFGQWKKDADAINSANELIRAD